jgi:hypothetical protein
MKWFIGLLILAAIAAGVSWKMGWLKFAPAPTTTSQTATTTPQQQEVQSGLPTSQTDATDQALAQDSAAVDAELSALTQDSAAIDSSLNDKQGTQSF